MKKGFFLVALCLTLVLSGCGTKEEIKNIDKAPAEQEEQVKVNPTETKPQETSKVTQKESQPQPELQPKTQSKVQKPISEAKRDTSKKAPQPQNIPRQNTVASVKPKSPPSQKTEVPKKDTITLSIFGSDDMGTVIAATEVEWREGDTAFSVLQRITREKKIQMEFSGSGNSVYVEGINNLYEFDKGAGSGWIYRVNGVLSSKSAGAHKIWPGDKVAWSYTLNVGDIGK